MKKYLQKTSYNDHIWLIFKLKIHQTQDFGHDYLNLSSANISSQWHIIQCTRIVKIKTLTIGKILTLEINFSVLKMMYLGQFVLDLSKPGLNI